MTDNQKQRRSSNLPGTVGKFTEDPISRITEDDMEQYKKDGVVMVKNLLHPEWLLLLEVGLERVLNSSSQRLHKFFEGEEGEFIETIRNFDVIPEIRRFVYDSPIADLVGKIIGSENLWLYSDEFFVKDRGNAERTPWHQDTPYWPIEGEQIASAWISLDHLSKEECLEYVAGSHRGTMYDGFSPSKVSEDPTAPHYGDQ
ncbi:MAG: phytanoyl-CoA dioxygenase family protein, partial [Actinomycetota bacterium]|nr:phytanoyl-CoA dioxygenase family protein [Actinomycetota bacterium]